MSKQFAKLFEVDGEQVLLCRTQDDEYDQDERECAHQMTLVDGLEVNIAVGGMTYEASDKFFDSFDEAAARRFREMAIDFAGSV